MLIFLRFFFIISFPFLSSYQFYQAKVEQAIFHAYHDPASIFLTNRSEKIGKPPAACPSSTRREEECRAPSTPC